MDASRFTVHSFAELPSTQVLAQEWCAAGRAKAGNVICASTQTVGYGRRDRKWESPAGNLFFTLIEDFQTDHIPWLGYAMGLALYDTVAAYLSHAQMLRLKWPNDLLLHGAKLSGMLLEIAGDKILLGVGVNIIKAPQIDQQTTALHDHSAEKIAPDMFLNKLLEHYTHWFAIGAAQGFTALRPTWLKRSFPFGTELTARLANGTVLPGIFAGLDEQGAVLLDAADGVHRITTADIYFKEAI